MFPVRIVIKLVTFSIHVFEYVYCITYIVLYRDNVERTGGITF